MLPPANPANRVRHRSDRQEEVAVTLSLAPHVHATVEDLVRSNLPLVGHLVREMLGRVPSHVSQEDLISAGMAGLASAAQAFDPERGIPFGGFATPRIRGALLDELRGQDWASRSVRSRARRMEAAQQELTASLG